MPSAMYYYAAKDIKKQDPTPANPLYDLTLRSDTRLAPVVFGRAGEVRAVVLVIRNTVAVAIVAVLLILSCGFTVTLFVRACLSTW